MPDKECIDKIEQDLRDRRKKISDDELDLIAERLENRMYENIGKSVVSKFFWIVGVITVSVGAYLKSKGIV